MSNDKTDWVEVGGDNSQIDMWDKAKDKTIVGKYVKRRSGIGKNNSNIYVLQLETGDVKGIWGGTVLDGRFEDVQIGMEVRVEFLGKATSKAGNSFNNFKVEMRPYPETPTPSSAKKDVEANGDIPF